MMNVKVLFLVVVALNRVSPKKTALLSGGRAASPPAIA